MMVRIWKESGQTILEIANFVDFRFLICIFYDKIKALNIYIDLSLIGNVDYYDIKTLNQ